MKVKVRPEWEHCPVGVNSLRPLTDKQFAASLDAFRKIPFSKINFQSAASWTIRYLNEAERRWRPGATGKVDHES